MFSCGNKDLSNEKTKNYNDKKNIMKNIYYLNYDLSGDFDVIFNGISLTKNKKDGVMMNYEYLNPYISKSGEQTVTLILKSVDGTRKIYHKTLSEISLQVYVSVNSEEPPFKKIHVLKLPQYKEAQESIAYTWTFIADVPFEISTLSDAKDLTKEDPNKLFQDVVEKYRNVHTIINEGKIEQYTELYKGSLSREMISMYCDESKKKEYLKQVKEFISGGKNHMLPLQNFKLHINPNGKIVELEDSMGKPALVSEDNEDRSTFGLQLYRSSKTGKLEVY